MAGESADKSRANRPARVSKNPRNRHESLGRRYYDDQKISPLDKKRVALIVALVEAAYLVGDTLIFGHTYVCH